mgnify:CR=1 FL=1
MCDLLQYHTHKVVKIRWLLLQPLVVVDDDDGGDGDHDDDLLCPIQV